MRTTLNLVAALAALTALLAGRAPADGDGAAVPAERALRADVLLTVDEALELVFGETPAIKRTHYLTDEQRAAAEALLGEELPSAVARPYVARDEDGALIGAAWFDTHRVRTKRETTMVAIDAQGCVLRVEVLAFAEPKRYLLKRSFYAQFEGEALDEELVLDGDIRNVTGATMTARATLDATRKALALHAVIFPPAAETAEDEEKDGDEKDDAKDEGTDEDDDGERDGTKDRGDGARSH